MKKVLSVLLIAAMLTSVAALAGCNCSIFDSGIKTGTLAAKLLLANERLDERVLGEKIDVGLSKKESKTLDENTLGFPTVSLLSSGAGHTWSAFPTISASMEEFSQFMESVEHEVATVAEDIVHMKKNVGVTDKWVKVGYQTHMLRVYDTYDVLIVKGEYGDIHVYYRYTDERAKNVYEMFSFMSYDDGTTGEIRTMCVPGERYEYMYNNSGGFTDYFIAENSRGYWMNTRFGYHRDENGYTNVSFSPYIVKDGLGFGAFLTVDSDNPTLSNAWYSIFDPDESRELFRVREGSDRYLCDLYMTAIKSGFVSVSADNADYDAESDVYQTAALNTLTTGKGAWAASEDEKALPKNDFAFTSGYVQHLYGEEIDYGSLEFTMIDPQMSLVAACRAFENHANSLGLTLYCDMDTVARSLEHASLLSDSFGESFRWNGYAMDSIYGMEQARDALQVQFDNARASYEEVKNFETVSEKQTLSSDAHFAKLKLSAKGENRFAQSTVSLSGISVSTSDVDLFENGKEYVLKVGISLLDEKGDPISVNTVPLAGTAGESTVFDKDSITLTLSGDYAIPKNLDRGRYAAVLYVATKDEGIRVSELTKIAFVNIENGEIESSAMAIEALSQDEHLILDYEIKNTRRVTLEVTKESYTYDEIKRSIQLEILAYGSPYHGAVLEYENGTAVEEGTALGKGTYRMMCYLSTGDGLAQSYVYLTVI